VQARKTNKSQTASKTCFGVGQTAGNLYVEDTDPTAMDTTAAAAREAFRQANMTPAEVQVAEIHDSCFNVSEILQLEALGYAERDKGAHVLPPLTS
jgi:hypothetical protein